MPMSFYCRTLEYDVSRHHCDPEVLSRVEMAKLLYRPAHYA